MYFFPSSYCFFQLEKLKMKKSLFPVKWILAFVPKVVYLTQTLTALYSAYFSHNVCNY